MKRDIDSLGDETFDVLIIGGGIYGATTARAAALRGLKVALVEQGDFGGATSANSLKVIHGGLRYLQHLNLKRMRESIVARRRLLQIAPHLVQPRAFVLPTYGYGMRSRFLMSAVLLANDIIAWDRNVSVYPGRHIPGGRTISRRECLDIIPGIDSDDLTGGAQWYDCIANDTERLTLSFVLAAHELGACVANYVRVERYLGGGKEVKGAQVSDSLDGSVFEIHAHLVIDATGPWDGQLLQTLPGDGVAEAESVWARAVNIVVDRPIFGDYAVGLSGSKKFVDKDAVVNKGSRYFFFVPWRGGTLIGTDYQAYEGPPENCSLEAEDIAALVNEVNGIYPAARLAVDEVSFSHVGLLPMKSRRMAGDANVDLTKNERIRDLEKSAGIKGVISVAGVKYTTAVQVADKVADMAMAKLGYSYKQVIPDPPLPGGDRLLDAAEEPLQISAEPGCDAGACSRLVPQLIHRYGTLYRQVLQCVREDPAYGLTLAEGHETIVAEVVYAVRHEMACKLSDVIMRRTGLGSRADPGVEIIRKTAAIMARELGWSERRMFEEISAVELIFRGYSHAC